MFHITTIYSILWSQAIFMLGYIYIFSNVCTFPILLCYQFRSGIREGGHLYTCMHIQMLLCLTIYLTGINNCISATGWHLTWPVGSWRSYTLALRTLHIQKLGVYLVSKVCFLLFFRSTRSLILNYRGSFVFSIGCLLLSWDLLHLTCKLLLTSLFIVVKTCLLDIIIRLQ